MTDSIRRILAFYADMADVVTVELLTRDIENLTHEDLINKILVAASSLPSLNDIEEAGAQFSNNLIARTLVAVNFIDECKEELFRRLKNNTI